MFSDNNEKEFNVENSYIYIVTSLIDTIVM